MWFPWKRKTSQRITPLLELYDKVTNIHRFRCDVTLKPNYCNHTNPDVTQSQLELFCSYGNPIIVAMKVVQSLTQSLIHRTSALYTGGIKWRYIHLFRMKAIGSSEKPEVCILASAQDTSVGAVTSL